MTRTRLLKLLKNLDALAENPGTLAEGESARVKARALRKEYKDLLAVATKRQQIQQLLSGSLTLEDLPEFVMVPRRRGPHTGSGAANVRIFEGHRYPLDLAE